MVTAYVMVTRQQDRPNHCRIKSRNENGQVKYFLVENLTFDSLYELVEHYKRNRLRSANFELSLREPVPKVQLPYGKEWVVFHSPPLRLWRSSESNIDVFSSSWYHDDLDRREAEDMLAKIPKDGAFLIRRRVQPDGGGDYAISFRYTNPSSSLSSLAMTESAFSLYIRIAEQRTS